MARRNEERLELYGTREIRKILSCSARYAIQLMHMFEYRGQMYKIGRSLKVSKMAFDIWLWQQQVQGHNNGGI